MDPSCCVPCIPRPEGCPIEMKCGFFPPINVFVDPCSSCENNIFKSPICNERFVKKGAKKCEKLFCEGGSKLSLTLNKNLNCKSKAILIGSMKYYVVDC